MKGQAFMPIHHAQGVYSACAPRQQELPEGPFPRRPFPNRDKTNMRRRGRDAQASEPSIRS
eukprot:6853112-Alexandrium_andersonii.AAC.1